MCNYISGKKDFSYREPNVDSNNLVHNYYHISYKEIFNYTQTIEKSIEIVPETRKGKKGDTIYFQYRGKVAVLKIVEVVSFHNLTEAFSAIDLKKLCPWLEKKEDIETWYTEYFNDYYNGDEEPVKVFYMEEIDWEV